MKKILVIVILLFAGPALAASYYAQDNAEITVAEWDTTPAGGGTDLTWASLANGDVLYANGKTISIANNVGSSSVQATLTTAAGDGTAGGGFTLAMPSSGNTTTLYTTITAGTADCLVISGTGTGTINIYGNVTAGSAANVEGILDSSTAGTVNLTGNVTGLSHTGYTKSGAGGYVNIYGNATGSANSGIPGINVTAGPSTITVQNCIAGNVTTNGWLPSPGCMGYIHTASSFTITGNIENSASSHGAHGKFRWVPSNASKYIKLADSGTPTFLYASAGIASDSDGAAVAAGDTAAQIADNYYFVKKDNGVLTEGTKTGGGGGAWGF